MIPFLLMPLMPAKVTLITFTQMDFAWRALIRFENMSKMKYQIKLKIKLKSCLEHGDKRGDANY